MYNMAQWIIQSQLLHPAYYIRTTLQLPPKTVLTVECIPLTADAQQGNNNRATDNNLYNSFTGIFHRIREKTEVDGQLIETH